MLVEARVLEGLQERLEMPVLMLWLFLVMVVEPVLEAPEELVVLKVLPLERQAVQEVQQVQLELQVVQ